MHDEPVFAVHLQRVVHHEPHVGGCRPAGPPPAVVIHAEQQRAETATPIVLPMERKNCSWPWPRLELRARGAAFCTTARRPAAPRRSRGSATTRHHRIALALASAPSRASRPMPVVPHGAGHGENL
jgi:hypothetical protein